MGKKSLDGKIALVAGATRGAGRAMAVSLAEAGAVVYATGRSSRFRQSNSRPETIEETAELIRGSGETGHAEVVDHNVEAEVKKLMEKINDEQGKLDICVNDIWGGEAFIDWDKPFWEQDIQKGISMFGNAVFTHLITSKHAVPLLRKGDNSILVEITDGVGYHYRGNVFYSLVKIATNHLSLGYSEEFKDKGIDNLTSVSLTPGFLRSEEMLDRFGVNEGNWLEAIREHPDFAGSETPYYIGRGLVQLAADPNHHRFDGQTLSTWGLSKIYEFTDIDGTRPDWERFHSLYKKGSIDPFNWRY